MGSCTPTPDTRSRRCQWYAGSCACSETLRRSSRRRAPARRWSSTQYEGIARRAGDQQLADEIAALTPRVHEFSAFLVDRLGVENVGARFPHRVVYHPACHATRMIGVGDAPLRLLRGVEAIELVDLPDAASCCGFGGTFAVKNHAVSTAMMADKLAHLIATGAEVCSAVDNSCLMHIGGGLARLKAGMRVLHLAQILADGSAA